MTAAPSRLKSLCESREISSSGAKARLFVQTLMSDLKVRPPVPKRTLKPARRGIAVRIALLALRFYKTYLSILFAGSCRFEPTCSQYAYEAIERFGVAHGVWLGLKRLLRCHPLSGRFGFDPVPDNGDGKAWEPDSAAAAVEPGCPAEAAHEVHS